MGIYLRANQEAFSMENKSYQGVCTVTDIYINPQSQDLIGKIRNPELNVSGFLRYFCRKPVQN